ncbi:MAG: hypothetical protein ACK449_05880 [Planctomycetota bacterium]|jgi:tubulin beta
MSKIVVIQVGQCGNRLGAKFWELLRTEHSIDNDGATEVKDQRQLENLEVFFHADVLGAPWDNVNQKYKIGAHVKCTPRAVLIDMEPSTLDAINLSDLGRFFKRDNYLYGLAEKKSNWAKGYYNNDEDLASNAIERILKEVAKPRDWKQEAEDRVRYIETYVKKYQDFEGFLFIHSIGGCAGAGLGTYLLSKVRENFPDKTIATFSVFPSTKISDSELEPYNAGLTISQISQIAHLVFCLDNEAVYDHCSRSLGIAKPSYADLNAVMSKALSAITAPLRLPNQSSAPVATLSEFIDKFLPAPEYRFLNVNPVPRLDTGLDSLLPDHLKPAAGYLRHDRSVGELLNRIKSQFSKLYAGRTNFSLYTAEGMTEEEFEIAESTVENVCADYAQLYM